MIGETARWELHGRAPHVVAPAIESLELGLVQKLGVCLGYVPCLPSNGTGPHGLLHERGFVEPRWSLHVAEILHLMLQVPKKPAHA